MTTLAEVRKALRLHINPEKAAFYPKFFKTEKGEYGEGDVFLGITVPNIRKISKRYHHVPLKVVEPLLYSRIHEERVLALFILVLKYEKGEESLKTQIYKYYVKHMKQVNNWDLVDLSAYKIVGDYHLTRGRQPLYKWSKSKNLWIRRVAIVSTFQFIRHKQLDDTYAIADILLTDDHDLIQKAVGWMLREAGKRDMNRLEKYIRKNVSQMPRTMLRYAIEKFPEPKRKALLKL